MTESLMQPYGNGCIFAWCSYCSRLCSHSTMRIIIFQEIKKHIAMYELINYNHLLQLYV